MKETIKNTIQPLEKCWWCCGFGQKPCFVTEQHPDGYEKCRACNGTGYGESLESYRRRVKVQAVDKKRQLADFIARHIMLHGDKPQSPCLRIQFKGGQFPSAETDQGGLCESALADVIESAIALFHEYYGIN